MSIRTHVVESALLIHVVQRSALLLVRVNSSIHIVRNRSVLCTQMRLAEQHVYKMQDKRAGSSAECRRSSEGGEGDNELRDTTGAGE